MTDSSKELFLAISMLTVFIPVGMVFLFWKRTSQLFRFLGIFLVTSFLFDIIHHFQVPVEVIKLLSYCFGLYQFLFYWWFLSKLFPNSLNSVISRTLVIVIASLFMLGAIPTSENFPQWWPSIFNVSQAVVLSAYSSHLLIQLTKKQDPMHKKGSFWVALGIFFYFFMNIFMYSFMHVEMKKDFWFLHSFFDVTKNILFSVGIMLDINSGFNNTSTHEKVRLAPD